MAQPKEPQGGATGIFFALGLESEWGWPKNHREGGRWLVQTITPNGTPRGPPDRGDTTLEYLSVEVSSGVRVRLELLE
jgi:hypothetical protein